MFINHDPRCVKSLHTLRIENVHNHMPRFREKTIGKEGAEKLASYIKERRLEAEPRAIPMATSAVISEAGIQGNLLAEDLIESEEKAVREWASTRAAQMPRRKGREWEDREAQS